MKKIIQKFPVLLELRTSLIVFLRFLTYPLRYLPGNSTLLGPPRGHRYSIWEVEQECPETCRVKWYGKKESIKRSPPKTQSELIQSKFSEFLSASIVPQFCAVLNNGRFFLKNDVCIISSDDKLIWNMSLNKFSFNQNLHWAYSILKIPKKQNLKNVVCLYTHSAAGNYYHWTLDLMTRFSLLKGSKFINDETQYIINHQSLPFQLTCFREPLKTGFLASR